MDTSKPEDSGIIVVKNPWGRKIEKYGYYDVETYNLQNNLPYDLKRGDMVSLSHEGYVIKHKEPSLPFNYKMYTIGIFLGYYFIKNAALEKIDIRRRRFFKKWEANTKTPKGFVPMCKIIHTYGKNSAIIPLPSR